MKKRFLFSVIILMILWLLPCSVAFAVTFGFNNQETDTDVNNTILDDNASGYVLQISSSSGEDFVTNYTMTAVDLTCGSSGMDGYAVYVAYMDPSTLANHTPHGTITVSLESGKAFILNSFVCGNGCLSDNLTITAGTASESSPLSAFSTCTILPSSAFAGITSFTLSWNNDNEMYFDNFSITPITNPVIKTQPGNSTVASGGNTSFTVEALGNSLSYQWQADTSGVGDSFSNVANGGVYSGATTDTLSITGVTSGMNHYLYRCVVTNDSIYTSNSDSAQLTLLAQAPTNIALDNLSIAENTASGVKVGGLVTTDPDSSSFTYSLVGLGSYPDNAGFTISGSDLLLSTAPNYEVKSSYNICIQTQDDTGLTYSKEFTIAITNVNEAPINIDLDNATIVENSASGTTIGTLTGTDPDAGSTFTYSLVSGVGDADNGNFTIDLNALKLGIVPDYEVKNSYSIRVRVSDGALSFDKVFTITITNINEAPTGITLNFTAFLEHIASGTMIGNITGIDPDAGSSFTYSLVSGTGDTDNLSFTISGDEIRTGFEPDYETKNSYSIRIRVSDGSLSYDKNFTIAVLDGNDPPTDITVISGSIAENSVPGSSVGTLDSTDNAGDTFTYTIIAGTGGSDNSNFSISGSTLKLDISTDYETKNSYSVRIRTMDNHGFFYEKALTIQITNVNETPTDLALSNSSIAENSASGATIGILSGTDPDAGTSFTYSLVSGIGDTDNASFTISGNALKLGFIPDYETKSSFSIRIRVSDGALNFDKEFTIMITDVNEAPTNIALSNSSIAEKSASGTTIGILSGMDTDAGTSFTYSLASGTGDTDNSSFTIDGNALKLGVVPDYEVKSSYSIRLRVSDGALSFDKTFTITITDVNEAPTDLALSNNSVSESSASGTTIGTLTGTDPDAGAVLSYSLPTGMGDNDSFSLTGSTLKLAIVPDYEAKASYSIIARVSDGALSFDKIFTITITDINEAPTDLMISSSSVIEHSAAGTAIGILVGDDPDFSYTHTYSLVSGTGDTDNLSFSVSGNTLIITCVADYEVKNSYSIRLRVSDGSLTYEKQFSIAVIDWNDPPTNISITGGSIDENAVSGSGVGTLDSTDPNLGDTFTYSITAGPGGTDNALFSIAGNSLELNTSADYETKDSYSVRIRSTDNNGLFFEKALIISITDVNEAPTDITLSNNSIAENSATGSTIASLTGIDPDSGSTFTYSLISGAGDTDNLSFTIAGNELRLGFIPDYETKNSYSIRLRVSDGALSFDKAFTVTITDVNEAPVNIALSNSIIAENSTPGTTIGNLSGTDPDAGASFTYTLVSGTGDTDNLDFTITGNELKLGFVPDYETRNSCSIRVRVSDGALNFDKVFIITITDLNEAPTNITLSNSSIAENSASGTVIGTLTGTDPDAGTSLNYSIPSGISDNDCFLLTGGTLKLAIVPDYELKNSYSVTARVSDGALSFDKEFTISIANVNEAPTDVTLSNSSIAENSDSGSTVGTLTGTDPDAGASFTYSLVSGTGDTDNVSFSIFGDAIKLGFIPDYELKNSFNIRVKVSDGSLTYEKQFTITIIDGNDPPTDITIAGSSIAENSPSGSGIGTLASTDPNVGDTFTYSITAGSGGTDNAVFSISGNTLILSTSADYETKSSYSVRIRSTDNNGLFCEKALIISITDVNEAPSDITLSNNSISENSASGESIGTLTGTDSDSGSVFTYSLVSGAGDTDNLSFTIIGNVLKLGFIPDYETKSSYGIRVRVSDGALSFDKAFTIIITDMNEPPTDITLDNSSIDENSASGNMIGTLLGTDPDTGSSLTYTLVGGAGDTDNLSFMIVGNMLKLGFIPDYETKSSCSIRVRVSDGALSFDKVFTITITDVNEAPTDIVLSNNNIAENSASGVLIGTLTGTDPDAGSVLSYSLPAGIGDNDSFTLTGNTVKLDFVPDFEAKNSFTITARVSDGALSFDKELTITITNVNEAPTKLTLSNTSITENTAIGNIIGSLSGSDPDAGTAFTYSLVSGTGDTDNASFIIVGNVLKLGFIPDYETKSNYSIRIRVSDGALSFDKVFSVMITDINEAPIELLLSNTSIEENSASGTAVGILSGTDPDAGSTLTYSFVNGTGDGDNTDFMITGDQLTLGLIPDYETKSSYSVRVRVSDGALSFDKVFSITIDNVNEAPTNITISKAEINENSLTGTVIGSFEGTDEDVSDQLTYTLVSGTGSDGNSSFTLAGSELKLAVLLNYNIRSSYSIRVRVTDTGGLYYEKQFVISVKDYIEPKPETTIETITLDVTNGSTDSSIAKIDVERTTASDGKISDSITFEEEKAQETIEKLVEEDSDTARIIAPKSEEQVSEVTMTIPAASVDLLTETDINLELETEDARISIPSTSLETAAEESDEDLYFKVIPLKTEVQRQEVEERATKDGMLIRLMGDNLSVIGSPMEIVTNMPQAKVDIILPLTGITIPEDEKEREEFLSKLAVYAEHSDGEKEMIKGELVEYQEGVYGLKFTVTKFSTFTIIKDERVKSDQCKILSVKLPSDTKVNGYLVIGKVYSSASIKLKITVSSGAFWKLYSDAECTHEIKNKLKPKMGLNKYYVKVFAEDGVNYQVYTIFIIRKK